MVVPVWPPGVVPTPPSARTQVGVLFELLASTLTASAGVWPRATRTSCALCGALPELTSTTWVSPPLPVAGTVNLAALPTSVIVNERFLGLTGLVPPHPATATPAAISASMARAGRP